MIEMPNEENLKNGLATQFKSGDEAVENGRKGGIASGEAKRRRKTLKEELLLMLEDETIQQSITAALIREATEGNSAGSVRGAFETIRDTIGEKPTEKVEMKTDMNIMQSAERLRNMFADIKNDRG